MGTGGGEYLLSLVHPYKNTYATEAYEPNYQLCMRTIKPLGIEVRQLLNDNDLPFEDALTSCADCNYWWNNKDLLKVRSIDL